MQNRVDGFIDKFKQKKYAYFAAYTFFYIFAALFVFRHFFLYGKTFIDGGDGISQHYNVLLYYSGLLKQAALDFFRGQGLHFPMWDFSLGLGEDILQVLNYHEIGDPLALIALICPNSYMDYGYAFIFLLRLYLGGLAFSWFSLWHGNERFSTLIGAFIYIFSGYTLVAVTKHLMFGVPILTFPLILLGIDKIIKGERGLVFILSVFLAAISNFYLLYIQGILAVLYAIYRYLVTFKKEWRKNLMGYLFKFILYGATAFLMSAVILLPVMDIMLSANRIGADNNLSLFYPLEYYLKFIADFSNMQMPGAWTNLGFVPIALYAVVIMFFKKKKYPGEKLIFLCLSAFALIPFFGYVFNGFGYVTNRWIFAYSMLNGYIFAHIFPEFKSLEFRERKKAAIVMTVIAVLSLITPVTRTSETYLSSAFIIMTAVVFLCINTEELKKYVLELITGIIYISFTGLITFSMWGQGSTDKSDTSLDKYIDYHEARRIIEAQNSDKAVEALGDEGYYRIQEIGVSSMTNSALNRSVTIPTRYFSLLSNGISEFLSQMYYNTTLDYRFTGAENRSILEALSSVKYYVVKEGDEEKLPFNYRNLRTREETYDGIALCYEADESLPLGYSYDSAIQADTFYELNAEQRQEAMLEGVVLSESTALPETKLKFSSFSVLKGIETEAGEVEISDSGFAVKKDMSVLRLELDGMGEAETYIVVKGLRYEDMPLKEMYSKGEWDLLTPYERAAIKNKKHSEGHKSSAEMRFGTSKGDYTDRIIYYTPYHMSYTGHDNFIINMGYDKDGITGLYLFFPDAGYYYFDRFDAVCQSTLKINERLNKLAQEPFENIVMSQNTISGTADLSRDKFMVFSLPYSRGWRAFVDGSEQELKRANIMFMGLALSKGAHEIVLRYETPYLRAGAALTLAGFIMLIIISVCDTIHKLKDRP